MILNKTTYNWSWMKHFRIRISTLTYRNDCFCDLLIVMTKIARIENWRLINWHDTIFFRFLLISSFFESSDIRNIKIFSSIDLFDIISIFNTWNVTRVNFARVSLHMMKKRIFRKNMMSIFIFNRNIWNDNEISS